MLLENISVKHVTEQNLQQWAKVELSFGVCLFVDLLMPVSILSKSLQNGENIFKALTGMLSTLRILKYLHPYQWHSEAHTKLSFKSVKWDIPGARVEGILQYFRNQGDEYCDKIFRLHEIMAKVVRYRNDKDHDFCTKHLQEWESWLKMILYHSCPPFWDSLLKEIDSIYQEFVSVIKFAYEYIALHYQSV